MVVGWGGVGGSGEGWGCGYIYMCTWAYTGFYDTCTRPQQANCTSYSQIASREKRTTLTCIVAVTNIRLKYLVPRVPATQ